MGGFLESFSTVQYFCRFCTYTLDEYLEDQDQEEPVFRVSNLRTPAHYNAAYQKKCQRGKESYKGIKSDSIFNELEHFHVCDPGQPNCIGHDLFIGGVVDHDLAAMIKLMVDKGWFSYDLLNRRIREYKLTGGDVHNRPAPVDSSGEFLGGYAVQNWTLLRLLPLFIGDKVDTNDEVWKLYLLLKETCELICAPALALTQIDLMQALIDQYLADRKRILPNPYRPKYHYFAHIPQLYRLLGPVILLWTLGKSFQDLFLFDFYIYLFILYLILCFNFMTGYFAFFYSNLGFEHYHQYFVKVAARCKNFINLPKTLVTKHTLLQAYQSTGPLFPSDAIHHSMDFPLVAESYPSPLQDFIAAENFSDNASVLEKVTIEEVLYKRDQWLVLEPIVGQDSYLVGQIILITCDQQQYKAIVEKHKAVRLKKYGIYKIKSSSTLAAVNLPGTLEDPCPHPTYEFSGKECMVLKHQLPK